MAVRDEWCMPERFTTVPYLFSIEIGRSLLVNLTVLFIFQFQLEWCCRVVCYL